MAEEAPQNQPQFVLIHGASHGAWCWYKIKCLLEAAGYKVTCLDLKSCGIDRSDPNTILNFQDYNKPLSDFLSNLPQNEKVVLVGHSAGGWSLTDAIHRFANKIHVAIYVAATMLKYGIVTDEDKQAIPDLSEYGDIEEIEYGMGTDQPPTSYKIKTEFQRKIYYQLSPKEDSDLASMLLRPAPLRAFRGTKFDEVGPDADTVPRIYIKTLHDNVLKLWQAESMISRWQPCQVLTLESDHSPFFSTPSSLFACLVKAAISMKYD